MTNGFGMKHEEETEKKMPPSKVAKTSKQAVRKGKGQTAVESPKR